jgi:tRNA pseudouridine38-40 synthase
VSTASTRIRLTLHYDGSGFHGWQVQPSVRTVQGELDACLSRLADRRITTAAAGRTDAGVHATGQVAHADVPAKWTPAALRKSLNAILAPDVWVAAAEAVSSGFHARYSASARGYIYRVGLTPEACSPFRRAWCWPLAERVQVDVLDRGAAALQGTHSFRGYAKSGQPERGYDCTVGIARWVEWSDGVELRIVANRFLHHMVRYLVGTMVDAARGRRDPGDVAGLLDASRLDPKRDDALETSPPAPAEGLFLARVYYGEEPEPEGPENEDLP